MSDILHDERTLMSDVEQRDIAEALFAPKQSREEIRNAVVQDVRHTVVVGMQTTR